jgi:hypothetical protein
VEPSLGPALERLNANPNGETEEIRVPTAIEELSSGLCSVDRMFDPPITVDFAHDRAFLAALLRRSG